MGIVGKIIKVGLIGFCLYGIYQCNHMMTKARGIREGSELESKLENELQGSKVQDLSYGVIYGSKSQKVYMSYGGMKNGSSTTLCN